MEDKIFNVIDNPIKMSGEVTIEVINQDGSIAHKEVSKNDISPLIAKILFKEAQRMMLYQFSHEGGPNGIPRKVLDSFYGLIQGTINAAPSIFGKLICTYADPNPTMDMASQYNYPGTLVLKSDKTFKTDEQTKWGTIDASLSFVNDNMFRLVAVWGTNQGEGASVEFNNVCWVHDLAKYFTYFPMERKLVKFIPEGYFPLKNIVGTENYLGRRFKAIGEDNINHLYVVNKTTLDEGVTPVATLYPYGRTAHNCPVRTFAYKNGHDYIYYGATSDGRLYIKKQSTEEESYIDLSSVGVTGVSYIEDMIIDGTTLYVLTAYPIIADSIRVVAFDIDSLVFNPSGASTFSISPSISHCVCADVTVGQPDENNIFINHNGDLCVSTEITVGAEAASRQTVTLDVDNDTFSYDGRCYGHVPNNFYRVETLFSDGAQMFSAILRDPQDSTQTLIHEINTASFNHNVVTRRIVDPAVTKLNGVNGQVLRITYDITFEDNTVF